MKRFIMERPTVLLLICILFPAILHAQVQSQSSSDYRIDAGGKIRQRINWNRVNAYFYEVEVERQSGERWLPETKIQTENIFVELSLIPGMYRYRINNYNVLGKISASSQWLGLRVFVAKTPAADHFSPQYFSIDSREDDFVLTLTGADLIDGAQVVLIASGSKDAKPVEPLEITYSGDDTTIQARFSSESLAPGSYDIVITNPGGLEQRIKELTVGFMRKTGLALSLGYSPLFPLSGYLFTEYNKSLYPLSFYGRFSYMPLRKSWGSIGIETNVSWTQLTTEHDNYTLEGQLFIFNMDALYQRWFNKYTMSIKLRAGTGVTNVTNIRFKFKDGTGVESAKEGTMLVNFNAGISFEWTLWQGLFVEAGIDYIYCFSSRGTAPALLRCTTGIGWRF